MGQELRQKNANWEFIADDNTLPSGLSMRKSLEFSIGFGVEKLSSKNGLL